MSLKQKSMRICCYKLRQIQRGVVVAVFMGLVLRRKGTVDSIQSGVLVDTQAVFKGLLLVT